MHEFKKGRVQLQLLLRDPTVRAEPTAQQRPESFERVGMRLAGPTSGVLALGMACSTVVVALLRQSGVDVVLIGVDHAHLGDPLLDQLPDRHPLDILQHPDQDRASPLDHPEDRRLILGQRPPPTLSLQETASPDSSCFSDGGIFLRGLDT